MKKLSVVFVSLLLMFALVGCSAKENSESEMTALDKALITSNKIIIGTSPDYPPFESLSAQGELEGFEIDMIKDVIDLLNTQQSSNYEIEFKQMDFSNIITALQMGQVDIGLSGFTYNPERDCIFATPHLLSKQVIVVAADSEIKQASDLVGKKCAAGLGTTGAEALGAIIGEENIQYPGDYTFMFEALGAGQLDAVICDEAVGDNYVAAKGFVKLEEALVNEDMSIIIKTGNTVLADAINQAVEAYMQTDAYKALLDKWGLD